MLSHFVEPVYLHSVTIGSLRHTGHLGRVLNQRLERLGPLPTTHRRNQPLLSGTTTKVQTRSKEQGSHIGGGGPPSSWAADEPDFLS